MIYIVEDDDSIRKLVSYALKKEGYEVADFPDSHEFWRETAQTLPELVMLDIMLPGEDGLSILKKLHSGKRTQDIPVIMLTAKDSEFDKVTGLDLGADDYIAKPFGMLELVSRVKALMRRTYKSKPGSVLNFGVLHIDNDKHIIKVNDKKIDLSYKEYELLEQLAAANGNVVPRETLLTRIWGEFYEESRTLDVHIRKLRVKLGEAGSMIKTVKNIGYKLEVDDYDG